MSALYESKKLLADGSPIAWACVTLAVGLVLHLLFQRQRAETSDIPLFALDAKSRRTQWMFDSVTLLKQGYRENYGKPFRVWTTEGYQVAIPPSFVDDLKLLPDHTLPSALRNFFLHKYVWPIDVAKLDYGHVVVKNDLNKALGAIFPLMRDELSRIISDEIPRTADWNAIKVHPKMTRLVTRVNSKIFAGDELCENEEWIKINSQYARVIFISSAKLRVFPHFLRPVAQYFISELREVWRCNARAKSLIEPVLKQRALHEANGDKTFNDAIEWLRRIVPAEDKDDAHFHAISQLGISAVSVNTSSQLLTNSLFNLAVYPEYVTLLRNEIDSVLADCGNVLTVEALGSMQKLDSFLKETLRYNGHLTATFHRNVRKPVKLRDGTIVPADSVLFVPTVAVNFDPSVLPEPDDFDGLRYYKLRQNAADASKYQLTSITNTQLQFGSGRHACPGRWFASHEVKLILIAILTQYDVKFKDGEDRPKGIVFQTNQLPNPTAEVLFRRRVGV